MAETPIKVFIVISITIRKDIDTIITNSKSFSSLEAAVGSMTLDYFQAIKARSYKTKISSDLNQHYARVFYNDEEIHWDIHENQLN